MTTQEKLIKPKLKLLELADYLGNVSEACRCMGYSRDTFYLQEVGLQLRRDGGRRRPRPVGRRAWLRRLRLSMTNCSRRVLDEELRAGDHTATWNGRDAHGHRVAGGTYFVRLEAGGERATRKVVFLGD